MTRKRTPFHISFQCPDTGHIVSCEFTGSAKRHGRLSCNPIPLPDPNAVETLAWCKRVSGYYTNGEAADIALEQAGLPTRDTFNFFLDATA